MFIFRVKVVIVCLQESHGKRKPYAKAQGI